MAAFELTVMTLKSALGATVMLAVLGRNGPMAAPRSLTSLALVATLRGAFRSTVAKPFPWFTNAV